MVLLLKILLILWAAESSWAMVSYNLDKNISDVAIALSEIIHGLHPKQLAILAPRQKHKKLRIESQEQNSLANPQDNNKNYNNNNDNNNNDNNYDDASFNYDIRNFDETQSPGYRDVNEVINDDDDDDAGKGEEQSDINDESIHKDVDDFIYQLHKLYFKSVIFYDLNLFFQFIKDNLEGSIESVNLAFRRPHDMTNLIQQHGLSHRLSLFIFYWGEKHPPNRDEVQFEEQMRVVVITRPRQKAFRIYYNQASPDGKSYLRLVNWYDGDNLGLQKLPLLPNSGSVYKNFQGRVFRVPVIHSPPWFWVNYENNTNEGNNTMMETVSTEEEDYLDLTKESMDSESGDYNEVNVTGGRDHRLLNLLAEHMNFKFIYIEPPERTQGSLRVDGDENETFTGGIGLVQNKLADFLLGDVSLSWERRKAVEFSFFTLADSGAFATHAPRRLNEALALVRPFKMDVWPYLILTVVFSGPIFYIIIIIPYRWCKQTSKEQDVERMGESTFYMVYIREITINSEATRKILERQQMAFAEAQALTEVPKNLFDRCIWFTVQLFLKQSCREPYHGYRAKFLMIVFWIAATYVLADVYSAQLTSQFARPAHEAPINTLQRLQYMMREDGYQLFVERESSSLDMLENGTEIFRHLFALMKHQGPSPENYLIDSIESGLELITDGMENKAVLGGRETLYFNMQQFGLKTFQLSQKLYTRYSAIAVQIGCPFLDSLNDVLIHLFEGGILDKMTNAEYEIQAHMLEKERKKEKHNEKGKAAENEANDLKSSSQDAENSENIQSSREANVIQPLNLRMLQGAFIVLFTGYGVATCTFILEILCHRVEFNCHTQFKKHFKRVCQLSYRKLWKIIRLTAARILREAHEL